MTRSIRDRRFRREPLAYAPRIAGIYDPICAISREVDSLGVEGEHGQGEQHADRCQDHDRQFVERPGTARDKRPVREIEGVDRALCER